MAPLESPWRHPQGDTLFEGLITLRPGRREVLSPVLWADAGACSCAQFS